MMWFVYMACSYPAPYEFSFLNIDDHYITNSTGAGFFYTYLILNPHFTFFKYN